MTANISLSFYSKTYLNVSIYKTYLSMMLLLKRLHVEASGGVEETLLCADAGESQRFHTSHLN